MSFGKSSSSQKSQSQATSQQTLDPQIKAALLGNYAQAESLNKPYVPYSGEMVAGFTPAQQAAQQSVLNAANSNVGGAELNNAAATTNAVAGYKPLTISPTSYTATTGQAANANAAQIDPSAVQTVTAPTVGADQINAFLNPYIDSVVSTSNADLERQRQIQQTYNDAKAASSGAWGGSGNAILDSQTNDAALRAMAANSASLRSAGYTTALGAAQTQADRQLSAAQGNQNTSLAAGTTNAGLTETTNLANASAANQFGLTNLNATNSAAATNAAAANAAAAANQSAGLSGAALNLQAGGQQASISAQQLAQALGLAQAENQVGTQQQQQQQAVDTANMTQYQNAQNWPLILQQLINQSLGLAGNPVLGSSSSSSSGSGSSTSTNFNSGLSFAPIPV